MSEAGRTGDPLNDKLADELDAAVKATRKVLHMAMWRCSDGHEHPRPATFTRRRLTEEVERHNPGAWSGAMLSLAARAMIDGGDVHQSHDLRLVVSERVADHERTQETR